jgi:hypothetical protein
MRNKIRIPTYLLAMSGAFTISNSIAIGDGTRYGDHDVELI